MKELVKHIESLLLEHNCVIVPQIGGFVTHHLPAQYIEEEHLFIPPIRTVGFSRSLTDDDGVLLSSYTRTYFNDEERGRTMMENHISEMKQELLENGTYDMASVGTLSMEENGNLLFYPCQAGTVYPSFYGLDAVVCTPIERSKTQQPSKTKFIRKTENSDITITLKRSWLNNIAAVAAAVIMFFVFSPDVQNSDYQSGEKAEFVHMLPFMPKSVYEEPAKTFMEMPATPSVAETAEASQEVNMTEMVQPEVQEASNTEPNGYCIVVASAIPMKNATAYAEQLRKAGHDNVQVYQHYEMIRVVFTGYNSESDAYNNLKKLSSNEEFASAWVLYIK